MIVEFCQKEYKKITLNIKEKSKGYNDNRICKSSYN